MSFRTERSGVKNLRVSCRDSSPRSVLPGTGLALRVTNVAFTLDRVLAIEVVHMNLLVAINSCKFDLAAQKRAAAPGNLFFVDS